MVPFLFGFILAFSSVVLSLVAAGPAAFRIILCRAALPTVSPTLGVPPYFSRQSQFVISGNPFDGFGSVITPATIQNACSFQISHLMCTMAVLVQPSSQLITLQFGVFPGIPCRMAFFHSAKLNALYSAMNWCFPVQPFCQAERFRFGHLLCAGSPSPSQSSLFLPPPWKSLPVFP